MQDADEGREFWGDRSSEDGIADRVGQAIFVAGPGLDDQEKQDVREGAIGSIGGGPIAVVVGLAIIGVVTLVRLLARRRKSTS